MLVYFIFLIREYVIVVYEFYNIFFFTGEKKIKAKHNTKT